MTDEELLIWLRVEDTNLTDFAADRIEALVKERDEALEWLSASQGYIADAVFALDKQEEAEAKLAECEARLRKAVEVLEQCEIMLRLRGHDEVAAIASTIITELKGESQDGMV